MPGHILFAFEVVGGILRKIFLESSDRGTRVAFVGIVQK
jgi:hypothetical protein